MKKNGKVVCDWCGVGFRNGPEITYDDGTAYHNRCIGKVGGPTDLGRGKLEWDKEQQAWVPK